MAGRCNGRPNCGDRSDEHGCPSSTRRRVVATKAKKTKTVVGPNKQYTRRSLRCTGSQLSIPRMGNDGTTFRCRGGWCISMAGRCNGRPNCGDRSDEHGCPSSTRRRVVATKVKKAKTVVGPNKQYT